MRWEVHTNAFPFIDNWNEDLIKGIMANLKTIGMPQCSFVFGRGIQKWSKHWGRNMKLDVVYMMYYTCIYQYCSKFSVKSESRQRSFHLKVNAFESVCQYFGVPNRIYRNERTLYKICRKTNKRRMSALLSQGQCINSLVPRSWHDNLKKTFSNANFCNFFLQIFVEICL